ERSVGRTPDIGRERPRRYPMARGLDVRTLRRLVGAIVGVVAVLGSVHGARAQVTLDVLHAFTREGDILVGCGVDGCYPQGGLIQATDGNFYGTTRYGGEAFGGTLSRLTPPGALTTLHAFDCSVEGCAPAASLIQASDGTLYGTTVLGGTTGGGTVFTITPTGDLTTLRSLDCGTDGCSPPASLLQGIDGHFYGTTDLGGPANGG